MQQQLKKLSRNFQAFPNIFPEVFPERKGENVKCNNAIAPPSRLLVLFWQLVAICLLLSNFHYVILSRSHFGGHQHTHACTSISILEMFDWERSSEEIFVELT